MGILRMITNVFYSTAKEAVKDFMLMEFPSLGPSETAGFLGSIYKFLNYEEESVKIRPTIYVTTNIHAVTRTIPNCVEIGFYNDENANNFNQRIKALMCFCLNGWSIYINYSNGVQYGIVKATNSIKEMPLDKLIFDKEYMPILAGKTKLIYMAVVAAGVMSFSGINGNKTNICFNMANIMPRDSEENISKFVNDGLTKLKTTKKKREDIKNMYNNIFTKMFHNSHGTICLIVDKDYKDTKGLLADGTWLPEPIQLAKIFLTSKSYSEGKLRDFSEILVTMLNYDGITVVDNAGRILAYNVFVASEKSVAKNIVGGARRRAAYTLLNTNNKKIIGVYFQSQDGDAFYRNIKESKAQVQECAREAENHIYKQMDFTEIEKH